MHPRERAAIGDLYDAYGPELYRLARIVVGDGAGAEVAVCEGFRLARARALDVEAGKDAWPELVRLTLLAAWTSTGDTAAGAALLGLTMFGDHTYREAAALLDIEAEVAADLLRAALRDARAPHVGGGTTSTSL